MKTPSDSKWMHCSHWWFRPSTESTLVRQQNNKTHSPPSWETHAELDSGVQCNSSIGLFQFWFYSSFTFAIVPPSATPPPTAATPLHAPTTKGVAAPQVATVTPTLPTTATIPPKIEKKVDALPPWLVPDDDFERWGWLYAYDAMMIATVWCGGWQYEYDEVIVTNAQNNIMYTTYSVYNKWSNKETKGWRVVSETKWSCWVWKMLTS